MNRKTTVARNGITTTLTFNNANQLTGESYAGGTLAGLSVEEIPDGYLRPFQINVKSAGNTLSTYSLAYDAVTGRMQTVTSGSYSGNYSYVANSPLVGQIDFKDGTTNRMTTFKPYDKLNRLSSISSMPKGSGELPMSFGSTYNTANQRNRVALQDGSFWVYEYDSLGQVTSGKKYFADNTPVPGQQFEYAHDDIGNRTSTKTGGDQYGQNLRPANYTANAVNQYTIRDVPGTLDVIGAAISTNRVTVNGVSAQFRRGEYFWQPISTNNTGNPFWLPVNVTSGGSNSNGNLFLPKTTESFVPDLDGNLYQDGRWTYTWDAENRLISMVARTAVGPQKIIDYEYDWRGRRIGKKVWNNTSRSGNPTVNRRFLYNGWNLIAEVDGNNANALVRSYVWGLDLSGSMQGAGGVGGLLMVKDASQGTHFAAYDLNGNVMGLVSATYGTNTAQYAYGPFGELIRATGPMAKLNPFRFSTKYQDDETDLVMYPYRPYSPSLGRWLSHDPIAERGFIYSRLLQPEEAKLIFRGRDPLKYESSPDLYVFVGNQATVRIDPLGLFGDGHNGKAGANDFKGHSDFFGGSCFDYTLEDHDPATWPWPGGNAAGHFQGRLTSEAQVNGAIHECNEAAFERTMHRLQDFWSHYNKGYRWDPPMHLGHLWDGEEPDHDNAAWAQAEAATKQMVAKWNKACPCKSCVR